MSNFPYRLAETLMAAKCIEADADFEQEVAALVRALSPAERRACGHLVQADRETPDDLKGCIASARLDARYHYLGEALRQ